MSNMKTRGTNIKYSLLFHKMDPFD